MPCPRLEIDLVKIRHNARTLVGRLAKRGISVMGITKAVCGSPEIAKVLLGAGVNSLGDSRIENIESMRTARTPALMTLICSPMFSQAKRIVMQADMSFNTELDVVSELSSEARKLGRIHGVVLMVELGDLREGIMPDDLEKTVRRVLRFPNITLKGIGTNLSCLSGVTPDDRNMGELSKLANSIETRFGLTLEIVSGGNSGNLRWALGDASTGRINNLRLGESLYLGRETLHREQIAGLHTDAITLIAEVIESKVKPSKPWGVIAQSSFGKPPTSGDRGPISQTIVAIGRQDVDPLGIIPPRGVSVLGASSDHVILDAGHKRFSIGSEIRFQVNYSALLRAMTSPFVAHVLSPERTQAYHRPVRVNRTVH